MSASRKAQDVGLLLLRLGVGGTLFAHGSQKLFGWFGGHGIEGTAGAMEGMGFRPGTPSAIAAGLGEAGGGTLILLGLATPLAGSAAAGTMATAASVHTENGFFAMNGGYELPAVLGLSAASLAVAGAGRYSLDQLTRHKLAQPWLAVVGLAGSLTASAFVISKRKQTQQARQELQARQEQQDSQAEATDSLDTDTPATGAASDNGMPAGRRQA
ncbi:MAG: RpiR family transcriptional regulator [Actinomycetia bacterium]|jgi:putative oxidoreductase|nr:RpiR family transcriptional regulator [Actinomycetes bacterium]